MKKILLFLLTISLLSLPMSACTEDKDADSQTVEASEEKSVVLNLTAEAHNILEKYNLSGGLLYSSESNTPGEYLDEDAIRGYYGDAVTMPDFSCVESYVVYIDESKPILLCEFGIFKISDQEKAEAFLVYLQARINKKIQNSIAYPSVDTSMLKNAIYEIRNGYLWYIAVKDANTAISDTLKSKLN